jgi:hypothetical protein
LAHFEYEVAGFEVAGAERAMDAAERNWWAKQRLTYNALLVLAGVAAFGGMAVAGETVCAADPVFEMTALTIAFQSVGYAVAMAIANVFYGLGSAIERWFRPKNPSLYRRVTFSAGATLSVAAPLLVPLGLFIKCTMP